MAVGDFTSVGAVYSGADIEVIPVGSNVLLWLSVGGYRNSAGIRETGAGAFSSRTFYEILGTTSTPGASTGSQNTGSKVIVNNTRFAYETRASNSVYMGFIQVE